MKKISILICIGVLFGLAGNANATSPMPEEVKPGMTATVCTVHIVCTTDHERGILEEQTAKFAFEISEAKRDVLEWVTRYINNKLNERNVTEFKVECRFPK
jgi:UDP-N-acetylglucosamine 2-epimerase